MKLKTIDDYARMPDGVEQARGLEPGEQLDAIVAEAMGTEKQIEPLLAGCVAGEIVETGGEEHWFCYSTNPAHLGEMLEWLDAKFDVVELDKEYCFVRNYYGDKHLDEYLYKDKAENVSKISRSHAVALCIAEIAVRERMAGSEGKKI